MRQGISPRFPKHNHGKAGDLNLGLHTIQNSLMPPTLTSHPSPCLPGPQLGAGALLSHVLTDTGGLVVQWDVRAGNFRTKRERGLRIISLRGKGGIIRY